MKNISKTVLPAVLILATVSACSQSSSRFATLTEEEKQTSAISVYVPPSFPDHAAKQCEEGYVLLEYDVSYTGEVKDDSIRVLADAGSSALTDAAVSAVRRWSYEPAIKDGALLERRNMRTAVNFEIEGCEPTNS